jgi:hypothetical protein
MQDCIGKDRVKIACHFHDLRTPKLGPETKEVLAQGNLQ